MPNYYFPLHPSQREIYFDQLIHPESAYFNVGGYIKLHGHLCLDEFREAVNSTPEVFDVFKYRLKNVANTPMFFCEENFSKRSLIELDFSEESEAEAMALAWMEECFNIPFQLLTDELLFIQYLLKISDTEFWYFRKYHHIIFDGYSFVIETEYISNKYRALVGGKSEELLYPSYREYAIKANNYQQSKDYQEVKGYWLRKDLRRDKRVFF